MVFKPNQRIDEVTVEQLLALRTTYSSDSGSHPIEELALVLAGQADPSQRLRADAHLAECPECSTALLTLHEIQARGVVEPDRLDFAEAKSRRSRAGPRIRIVAMAAAAGLLLGVAAWFFLPPGEEPAADLGAGLAVKGSGDALHVAVQRGSERFTASPMEQLIEGDLLGIFYSTATSGYLAVLTVDEKGQSSLLYPAGGTRSAAIAIGAETPLPDGAIVRQGSGCEWLVAVFSDAPLVVDEISAALDRSKRTAESCRLELEISDARTVRVFPVKR